MDDRILLVTAPGKEEESIIRMARVGYENVIGFLDGGFDAWKNSGKNIDMIISIDAEEFLLDYNYDDITVVDVRKESEYNDVGHVERAVNVVLQEFDDQLYKLENMSSRDIYIHCESGYRSMIAASLLRKKGFKSIKNVAGGYNAIIKTSIPVEVPKFSES
jgi:rhodanese-related sulfurtransferase